MSLLDLIFPKKCLNCPKEGRYICDFCLSKIRSPKPVCCYCERPSIDGMTHFGCIRKFGIDGLTSPRNYEGVIRRAILTLKYKFASEVAKELAEVLVKSLLATNYMLPATTLVPIPLYWFRENWRGFNQVTEIGRLVAKEMGWQFEPNLLVRKKLARPQTELKGKDRGENIKGVFSLNPAYNLQPTTHNLILFDDVYTTGSTLKEAARVLKRGGAKNVWGLVMAR